MKANSTERFVFGARAALAFERVWPALWPATGIAGACLAAALFGVFAILPWILHALVLAGAITAMGLVLYFHFADLRLPDWQDGARRLERDSRLSNRPISERDDVLFAGQSDPWAEELWRAHMPRHLEGIGRLRLTLPASDLPRRDPHALRFVVLLLIAAGIFFAGSDWNRRLASLFNDIDSAGDSIAMDAWIDPPAYTGIAPIYLSPAATSEIAVPAGSLVNLRVHGASQTPLVSMDGAAFQGSGGEYASTAPILADTHLRVRAGGRTLGDWNIRAIPDRPPAIAFAAAPAKTERGALKLAFVAHDDYGLVSARAILRPHGRYGKPFAVELPLDSSAAKTLTQTAFRDLTGHPYAGLDVDIVLEARDGAGQTATSKAAEFKLPARVFINPLARALIEQRQNLATGDVVLRDRVARTVDALTLAPDRFYANQLGLYLVLRSAYWAMKTAQRPEDYERIENLFWQTAIGLEQGGLLTAADELRRLQQMLAQALAQGAPQEVIDSLLQRYRDALQRYLQAMAANPPQAGTPPPPGSKVLSQQDLETLLKTIEELAASGARAQAQQLLAVLQNLLENLHMTQGSGGGIAGDKALSDAIQGLGDVMGKQRALLDKTFRQQQGKADPKDGGAKGLAQDQGKVREQLNQILKGLGDQKRAVPDKLGEAGRSMGKAERDFGESDLDGAGRDQKDALEALRQGASKLAQALMKGTGQGTGNGQEDPLGRNANGPSFGAGVKVPGISDLQRARNILKELRRRAAERGRPQEELDYIDRLLKQF